MTEEMVEEEKVEEATAEEMDAGLETAVEVPGMAVGQW